jgi:hypothetical protein
VNAEESRTPVLPRDRTTPAAGVSASCRCGVSAWSAWSPPAQPWSTTERGDVIQGVVAFDGCRMYVPACRRSACLLGDASTDSTSPITMW